MVKPSHLDEFYREVEEDNLKWMRYLQLDCGEMARIREEFPDDWEIEELTRSIIFDNVHLIEILRQEVEHAKATRKEFARIRWRGQSNQCPGNASEFQRDP
jgi:hypothetical protein